jgi:hypothetical protein
LEGKVYRAGKMLPRTGVSRRSNGWQTLSCINPAVWKDSTARSSASTSARLICPSVAPILWLRHDLALSTTETCMLKLIYPPQLENVSLQCLYSLNVAYPLLTIPIMSIDHRWFINGNKWTFTLVSALYASGFHVQLFIYLAQCYRIIPYCVIALCTSNVNHWSLTRQAIVYTNRLDKSTNISCHH